jgi:hypothetical protein
MTNEELRKYHEETTDFTHALSVDRCLAMLPALLDVVEAAESVAKAERDFACGRLPPPGRNERLVNLESALADFAKAREAM